MPPSARRPCARTSPMAATPGRCHTAFLRRCHPGAGMTLPPRVQTVLAGRPPKNRKLRARPSTAQHTPSGCRRCIPSGRECRRSPRFGTWCPPSTAASRQVHVISGCFPQKYFILRGLIFAFSPPSFLSLSQTWREEKMDRRRQVSSCGRVRLAAGQRCRLARRKQLKEDHGCHSPAAPPT